jgi:hypothetical protein
MIMGCQIRRFLFGRTMSSEEVVAGNVKGEIKEGGEVEQSSRCDD